MVAGAGYVLQRVTRGVRVPVGVFVRNTGITTGLTSGHAAALGSAYGGAAEISGDGAMIFCPVNRNGLEFMYGRLSVAMLDADGAFRSDENGAAVESLRARQARSGSHAGRRFAAAAGPRCGRFRT